MLDYSTYSSMKLGTNELHNVSIYEFQNCPVRIIFIEVESTILLIIQIAYFIILNFDIAIIVKIELRDRSVLQNQVQIQKPV